MTTTGVQLQGGVSEGSNFDLSALLGGLSESQIQVALNPELATAVALNASRGPRPQHTPHQFLQPPPYVPDQTMDLDLQPIVAQGTNLASDADPTPYQVWQGAQPQGQAPMPVNPAGGPLPGYPMQQGYPGMPQGPAQPPGMIMRPPQPAYGQPPPMAPLQSPWLDRARQINQAQGQLGTQMSAPPPAPPRPQMAGHNPNVGWGQNMMSRMRGSVNPGYQRAVSNQYGDDIAAYNKQLDQNFERQKEGFKMANEAAQNTYTNERQLAETEWKERQKTMIDIFKLGIGEAQNRAEKQMVEMFGARPSPERRRWAINEYNRTGGLVDLIPMLETTYGGAALKEDNRQATLHNKKQLFGERAALFDSKLAKAKAGALLAQDRAEILHDTKDTVKQIAQLRAEKLQLDNDMTRTYGDEDAQTKIALRRTTMQNAERAALDTARKGTQALISDYLKMEQLGQMDATMKDKIKEAYGESRTITDEEAMTAARKDLGDKASEKKLKIRADEFKKNFQGLPDQIARGFSWMQKEFREEADQMMVGQKAISNPPPRAQKLGAKPPDKYNPQAALGGRS